MMFSVYNTVRKLAKYFLTKWGRYLYHNKWFNRWYWVTEWNFEYDELIKEIIEFRNLGLFIVAQADRYLDKCKESIILLNKGDLND